MTFVWFVFVAYGFDVRMEFDLFLFVGLRPQMFVAERLLRAVVLCFALPLSLFVVFAILVDSLLPLFVV